MSGKALRQECHDVCPPPKHTLVGLEQCEARRGEGSGRGQWPTKGLRVRVGLELLHSMREATAGRTCR